jgi:5-methylcytosine-specific restriction endonuclease McrA
MEDPTKLQNMISEAARSLQCLNCGRAIDTDGSVRLFCSDLCKEVSRTIRYGRAIHKDGRINRPDVAETWEIKCAWAINGMVYPRNQREVKGEVRNLVFERAAGCCQECGGVATEIDHLNKPEFIDDINHPDNLQVLCSDCHRKKSLTGFTPTPFSELPGDMQERILELTSRLDSPVPQRLCDDEVVWPTIWNRILKERRQYMKKLGSKTT